MSRIWERLGRNYSIKYPSKCLFNISSIKISMWLILNSINLQLTPFRFILYFSYLEKIDTNLYLIFFISMLAQVATISILYVFNKNKNLMISLQELNIPWNNLNILIKKLSNKKTMKIRTNYFIISVIFILICMNVLIKNDMKNLSLFKKNKMIFSINLDYNNRML